MIALALFIIHCALFIISCARMGQPDGGWYDDDPPKVIGSTPADQSANVKSKKITIYFDEYIKLEDATSKVIVSPPQLEMPEIKSAGKRIIVELKDTLKENTTYTIDFSDAITDIGGAAEGEAPVQREVPEHREGEVDQVAGPIAPGRQFVEQGE